MGADRAKRGRRRPVRATARIGSLGISAVLLVGCASMPDSGDMRDVESTPRQDSKVRVFALAPADDAEPQEIVQGFLEALTSDDLEYETARKYLTGKALKEWDPGESTTVLAEAPTTPYTPVTGRDPTPTSTGTSCPARTSPGSMGSTRTGPPAAITARPCTSRA